MFSSMIELPYLVGSNLSSDRIPEYKTLKAVVDLSLTMTIFYDGDVLISLPYQIKMGEELSTVAIHF